MPLSDDHSSCEIEASISPHSKALRDYAINVLRSTGANVSAPPVCRGTYSSLYSTLVHRFLVWRGYTSEPDVTEASSLLRSVVQMSHSQRAPNTLNPHLPQPLRGRVTGGGGRESKYTNIEWGKNQAILVGNTVSANTTHIFLPLGVLQSRGGHHSKCVAPSQREAPLSTFSMASFCRNRN